MSLLTRPCSRPVHFTSPLVRQGPKQQCLPCLPSTAVGNKYSQPTQLACMMSAASEGFELTVPNTATIPKVLIAGGGIGGLVAALGLLKKGFDVQIFERDLTAIRGEGKYRGPIQIQSNALAALEAIDKEMAEEVFQKGVVTGDRVNGLCDGFTGEWYVKFDTFSPAAKAGLPVTRVINRVTLQEILCKHVQKWSSRGADVILEGSHVISFEELGREETNNRVKVLLEDGRTFKGDLLIGADGIWSKVRKQLFGASPPHYSEYTCYTGISDFTPADIDTVGYRVFLGNGKYFVSSDVGSGKMQWYGFHKEPQGGTDLEGQRKNRLLEIFGTWCDEVVDLINATPEEDVLRRDIFDKAPMMQWHKGHVIVLGDAAHAMQPNLGQGGCMAIEDAYLLSLELGSALVLSKGDFKNITYTSSLQKTVQGRRVRAAIIHWLAAMAAVSATTYKTYLGEGLGVLSFITKYRIPHFGKVAGRYLITLFMPLMLGWILGGNLNSLKKGYYTPYCRLEDRPKAYKISEFKEFVYDDKKLRQAALADWWIIPSRLNEFTYGVKISQSEIRIGSDESSDMKLRLPQIEPFHARIYRKANSVSALHDRYFVETKSKDSTLLNGNMIPEGKEVELTPGDILQFGFNANEEQLFKIKLRHISCRETNSVKDSLKEAVNV